MSLNILLYLQTAMVIAALFVFVFTLRVMSSFKAIHGNCKFFLMCVAFGQSCIIVSHILKIGFLFSIDKYDHAFLNTQAFFKTVQPLNELGLFLVDLNNCMLIVERTYASARLKRYEEKGTQWVTVLALEMLCIIVSAYCSYLVHFAALMIECCSVALVVSIISLALLFLCHYHSKRAYNGLKDVGSRYQMREVEYVTRALIPACLLTILLRATVIMMALFGTLFAFIFPTYMTFLTAYQCIQTLNAAQYGLVIILIHDNMRVKAIRMIRSMYRRRKSTPTARISDIDKRADRRGQAYFDQLRSAWD